MPLSLNERDRRYRAVRAMMEEKDLTLLLVASNATWTGHVRYFSNFFAPIGYFYLVFPREGDPTQFVGAKNSELVASKGWVKDTRTAAPNFSEALVKRIKELDYRDRRIGLVGAENISFPVYEHLKKELASATFVDATQDIFNLRMIKNEEELVLVRRCAQLTEELFNHAKKVSKVGIRELDIYAEVNHFLWKQGIETAFILIGSGRFPISARIWPSDRILGPEDSIFLELSPRFEGYYTQICVTHPLQEPNPQMKEFLDVNATALKASVKMLKPGNNVGDVAIAMQAAVEKAGYSLPYRAGHSMGHDLDEPPGIVAGGKTVLRPGMTIVLHPSVMDKNGDGVFVGDSYLITETGWERLTTTVTV